MLRLRYPGVSEGQSGPLVVPFPARLIVNVSFSIGNASTDPSVFSIITCYLEHGSDHVAWHEIGKVTTRVFGGPYETPVSLVAGLDVGSSTHDVRVVCFEGAQAGNSWPRAVSGALTVVATAR